MRMREIAEVLEKSLPKLQVMTAPISGSPNFTISRYAEAISAVRAVHETGVLQEETGAILEIKEVVSHTETEIVVGNNTFNRFNSALGQLRSKGALLLETLKATMLPEKPEQVSVKLPEETDLEDLASSLSQLHKALTQLVVNPYMKGSVHLIAFDRGSNWVEIYLGTLLAVQVLASVL